MPTLLHQSNLSPKMLRVAKSLFQCQLPSGAKAAAIAPRAALLLSRSSEVMEMGTRTWTTENPPELP